MKFEIDDTLNATSYNVRLWRDNFACANLFSSASNSKYYLGSISIRPCIE